MAKAEVRIDRLKLSAPDRDPGRLQGFAREVAERTLRELHRAGQGGRVEAVHLRLSAEEARDPARVAAAVARAVKEAAR